MLYGHLRLHNSQFSNVAAHQFIRQRGRPLATLPEITVVVGSEVQRTVDTIRDDTLIIAAYLHLVSQSMGRGRLRLGVLFLPILDDPLCYCIRSERNGGHYRANDSEVD